MAATVPDADIHAVFESWRGRVDNPELRKLTDERVELIGRRLKAGNTVDDLDAWFEYVFTSGTGLAKWFHGDNPRKREYLDLTNLLRAGKLRLRVETALKWRATRDADDESASDCNTDLGPMGAALASVPTEDLG